MQDSSNLARGSAVSTVLVPPSCSRPIIIPHPSFPLSADILWNAKQLSQSQHPSLPSRHQANFCLAQLSSHKPTLPHSQASADRPINSLRRHKLGESKYKLPLPSIISISSLAQLNICFHLAWTYLSSLQLDGGANLHMKWRNILCLNKNLFLSLKVKFNFATSNH